MVLARMTAEHEETQENKQRCWIEALHEEANFLLVNLGLRGARPVILIHEGSQDWGRWDPLNLSISMSRTLIEECPWWVVLEIFKHELAHLACDQTCAAPEPPHGPTFRMFCEALEVESWARAASCGKPLEELRALSDWRTRPASSATVKYRRRLQKLLALAESSNEHEAYLAMRRARELQSKHRIEEIEQGIADGCVNLEIGLGKQRQRPYEGRIASILINHFHVEIVFLSRFNAMRCQEEALIDLMGRPEDVVLAEYVHSFLHKSAEALWQSRREQTGAKGLRARNSYIRGLLAGFHEKLDREREDSALGAKGASSQALILAADAERLGFKAQRYPRLTSRLSTARVDGSAFAEGRSEGAKLTLRTPIASSAPTSTRPKLLRS